jgi:hypothetical protein
VQACDIRDGGESKKTRIDGWKKDKNKEGVKEEPARRNDA